MGNTASRFIARALELASRPFTLPYRWWFGFRLWTGTVYIVCPDSWAIFFLLVGPSLIFGVVYLHFWYIVLAFIVVAPLFLWTVLRIRHGQVIRMRSVLGLPYWFTWVNPRSTLELSEPWGEDRPSGIAFSYLDTEVHLGSSFNARTLHSTIQSVLEDQAWKSGADQPPQRSRPPERIDPML